MNYETPITFSLCRTVSIYYNMGKPVSEKEALQTAPSFYSGIFYRTQPSR